MRRTQPRKLKGSPVLAFTSPEKLKGSPAQAFCLPERSGRKIKKKRVEKSRVFEPCFSPHTGGVSSCCPAFHSCALAPGRTHTQAHCIDRRPSSRISPERTPFSARFV